MIEILGHLKTYNKVYRLLGNKVAKQIAMQTFCARNSKLRKNPQKYYTTSIVSNETVCL